MDEPRTRRRAPQATEQFKKDADALLAPFGNRIPAGVKGLDAVLSEYVAFKEADAKRKKTVASNPLAKRMYDVLEECAAGIAPPSEGVADANDRQKSRSDALNGPSFPSPSSAAMPPPPARSPHRGKKRGGAVPRRNAPVGGAHASGPGPTRDQSSKNVFGSLDDDAAGVTTWRNYELPRALNDARVQERLAAVIAERIPELGSDGRTNKSDGVFFLKRREDDFASPEKEKRRSPTRGPSSVSKTETFQKPSGIGSPVSGAGVRDGEDIGGLDVDAVMQSLFENDTDGTMGEILGPLLGMPSGDDARRDASFQSPRKRAENEEKNAEDENAKRRRFSDGVETATKRSLSRAEKDARAIVSVPAHVRALDVDAFVKSIEY